MAAQTTDSTQTPPSEERWDELSRDVKAQLLQEMGDESWYLIIATVVTVSNRPRLLAEFWSYLTTHDASFAASETQSRLSDRFCDLLLKQITLIGAPRVLSALIPLANVQTDGKGVEERGELDLEQWSNTTFPALHARGIETITSVYGNLWQNIFRSFGPHRPQIGLHELTIVYGLYLADFTHLTPLETELVAFTSIICQGLRGPALWHVRGLGRLLGARGHDDENDKMRRIKDVVRGVKVAVATVVEFCGQEMVRRSGLDASDGQQGWPNVGDVVRELGGWGGDE
ncbi:hypothetical protein A1O7_05644 [Cladophialophora yegresii CBS 114405]|uniref:Uncharacterized protein n=1 Tax=Cladophialophora yegresii CBS 114405 TaxID=1182544 RepID=W9WI92_9EURO|nr:uncharacterized protein A1O7_05644 [Cladophialophora yegresii CBS 114405]EXJ58219.1 hypothetical protein A1O7_05644 [Cladophialophora yegresii CBS 114405]